eukprot:1938745-Pyramimonas_sp.AAC.1
MRTRCLAFVGVQVQGWGGAAATDRRHCLHDARHRGQKAGSSLFTCPSRSKAKGVEPSSLGHV